MADSDQETTEASNEEVKADPYQEVLQKITNPQGTQKYADTVTALESIAPKDSLIVQLQEELASARAKAEELEAKVATQSSAEELVKQVMETTADKQSTDTPSGDAAGKEGLDIGELVKRELASLKSTETRQRNREQIASTLSEQFGDKANDVLTNKMAELNVSPEFFTGVIEQSPKAALELLGLNKSGTKLTPVKPHGSVRTESFSETPPDKPSSVILASSKEQRNLWDRLMQEATA